MTDDWIAHQMRCIHFNGVQHRFCEIGISYKLVRDDSHDGMYRWPCLTINMDEPASTSCDYFQTMTDEEAQAYEGEIRQAIADFLDKVKRGICPHCDTPIENERQVGRCVYAEPCGHRLWQGKARGSQELNAEMLM